MCIAIPAPGQRDASTGWHGWRRLASSPARLLGFSSALQLAGLALAGLLSTAADPLSAFTPPLFVALGTLLLGVFLARAPLRLRMLPFSYPLLVALFALITAGGLLALLPSWTLAGQALVFSGWLIALRGLWWKLKWAPRRLSQPLSLQFGVLAAMAAVLGGLLATQLWLPPQFTALISAVGLAATLGGGWLLALGPGNLPD